MDVDQTWTGTDARRGRGREHERGHDNVANKTVVTASEAGEAKSEGSIASETRGARHVVSWG